MSFRNSVLIQYLFCATASLRAISKYTWFKVVNSDACRPCKSCKCMQQRFVLKNQFYSRKYLINIDRQQQQNKLTKKLNY